MVQYFGHSLTYVRALRCLYVPIYHNQYTLTNVTDSKTKEDVMGKGVGGGGMEEVTNASEC
jgi:hypothetical protein